MNVPKRRFRSVAAVSLGQLVILTAFFWAFIHGYYGKAQDETAIRDEVLRMEAREHGATHVGMEEGNVVVDPNQDMMRALLVNLPKLQPASALVKTGANKRFTLITISAVEWQGKNQVSVWGFYQAGGGGFSSHNYVATRGKVSKANPTGWVFKQGALGCGYWDKLTILHDGTASVIEPTRR